MIKVDCHLHIYTSWYDPWLERGPHDLESLTIGLMNKKLDAATMTSFSGRRFDRLMDTAKNLPCDWEIEEDNRGAVVTPPRGKKFIWFNTDEKETGEGHILIIGNKRESKLIQPYQGLEETIGQVQENDYSVMLVADHPLMALAGCGIGRENLKRYREHFTAGELNGNCRWPFSSRDLNIETRGFCQEIDLPVIANSDGYSAFPFLNFNCCVLGGVGETYTGYNERDLDLTSASAFLYSMKKAIEKGNVEELKLRKGVGNSLISVASHVAADKIYKVGRSIPLLGKRVNHPGSLKKIPEEYF